MHNHVSKEHCVITKKEANRFVNVDMAILDKECRLLGIKTRSYPSQRFSNDITSVADNANSSLSADGVSGTANGRALFPEWTSSAVEEADLPFSGLKNPVQLQKIKRSFNCMVCSTSFASKASLDRHRRLNFKTKPFKCLFENCQKTASRKDSIYTHIQGVHFDINGSQLKLASQEEKTRAYRYMHVQQDIIDGEKEAIKVLQAIEKRLKLMDNNGELESPDGFVASYVDAVFSAAYEVSEIAAIAMISFMTHSASSVLFE